MQTAHGLVAIVEDDAPMRKSIDRLLRANNYPTASFASAEEFLRSGVADQASAVVLDIHLPGMSGLELRLHLSATGSKLPVVFITALDDEATRLEALSVGCIDCLHKPFEARQLTEAVQAASAYHVGGVK